MTLPEIVARIYAGLDRVLGPISRAVVRFFLGP